MKFCTSFIHYDTGRFAIPRCKSWSEVTLAGNRNLSIKIETRSFLGVRTLCALLIINASEVILSRYFLRIVLRLDRFYTDPNRPRWRRRLRKYVVCICDLCYGMVCIGCMQCNRRRLVFSVSVTILKYLYTYIFI